MRLRAGVRAHAPAAASVACILRSFGELNTPPRQAIKMSSEANSSVSDDFASELLVPAQRSHRGRAAAAERLGVVPEIDRRNDPVRTIEIGRASCRERV